MSDLTHLVSDLLDDLKKTIHVTTLTNKFRHLDPSTFIYQTVINEHSYSIALLENVFLKNCNSDSSLEAALRLFLKYRWTFIQDTPASYCAIPGGALNQACILLASTLAKPGESRAKILMHTLEVEHYGIDDTLTSLTENEEGLLMPEKFIVTHDGKAVINLYDWFSNQNPSANQFNVNQQYRIGPDHSHRIISDEEFEQTRGDLPFDSYADYCNSFQAVQLSQKDIELLKFSAPPHTEHYVHEIEFTLYAYQSNTNMATAVRRLIDDCFKHSAHRGGSGTISEAHPNFKPLVLEFFTKTWPSFPLAQRERVNQLIDSPGSGCRFDYILLILREAYRDPTLKPGEIGALAPQDIALCLGEIGYRLERIFTRNSHLFDLKSRNKSPISTLHANALRAIQQRGLGINPQPYQAGYHKLANDLKHYANSVKGETRSSDMHPIEFLYHGATIDSGALLFKVLSLCFHRNSKIFNASIHENSPLRNKTLIKLYDLGFLPRGVLAFSILNRLDDLTDTVLRSSPKINNHPHNDCSPLSLAYSQRRTDLIKTLIKKQANIREDLTNKKESIIHIVATENWVDVFDTLCKHSDFDINAQQQDGKTALHIAAEMGHLMLVQRILNYQPAQPNITMMNKLIAMISNLFYGTPTLELNIAPKTRQGATPLHLAAKNNELLIVKELLCHPKKKEFLDQRDHVNNRALDIALSSKNHSIIVELIKNDCDLSGTFGDQQLSFSDWAFKVPNLDILNALVNKDLLDTNKKIRLLNWAINQNHRALANLLIHKGTEIKIDPQNKSYINQFAKLELKIPYSTLMNHPCLDLFYEVCGFKSLCAIASIEDTGSLPALKLYAKSQEVRLKKIKPDENNPHQLLKINAIQRGLEANDDTAPTLIVNALKLDRETQRVQLLSPSSFRTMPDELKEFKKLAM